VSGAQDAPPKVPPPPATILLLGTFHFDDAGLDAYKPEHRMDVLSPERQREIEEVVRCLTRFPADEGGRRSSASSG